MNERLNVLIATGIYPPEIGGPAQYAKNLKDALLKQGHKITVVTYGKERKLPTGFRHLVYLLKVLTKIFSVDLVIALDTFSVGLPAVLASRIFHKKILLRTGGDFLWESYVERTGEPVLFRNFYNESRDKWSLKENIIFKFTNWTLRHTGLVIFSTDWQRRIFVPAYNLDANRTAIIENFYGTKLPSLEPKEKRFIGGTRPLKWKNIPMLKKAFTAAQSIEPSLILDVENTRYEEFMSKIQKAYAVILVSLGDISPNMILDAISYNKPFILTRETGLYEKFKDVGIFVDPQNPEDIKNKILFLADETNYQIQIDKIKNYNFTHSWDDIGREFVGLI